MVTLSDIQDEWFDRSYTLDGFLDKDFLCLCKHESRQSSKGLGFEIRSRILLNGRHNRRLQVIEDAGWLLQQLCSKFSAFVSLHCLVCGHATLKCSNVEKHTHLFIRQWCYSWKYNLSIFFLIFKLDMVLRLSRPPKRLPLSKASFHLKGIWTSWAGIFVSMAQSWS